MASECGRNAQQIMSYRDISNRAEMGISLRPMAVEIDVKAALRPLVCKPRGASNMVNPKLRHCALGSAVRPETDSGSRKGNFRRRGPNCGIPATGSDDYRIGTF